MTSELTPAERHYEKLVQHNQQQASRFISKRKLQRIGIVGAGLMGSSIAENCVRSNRHVLLMDANDKAAKKTIEHIKTNYELANIQQATSFDQFKNADLVIESVVETIEVKKIVLTQICEAINQDTLVATNTSAIPLAKLVPFVKTPSYFCGIHFCHPELMSLVEVIRGAETSNDAFSDAIQFVFSLGKMPIAVKDCAGFVVNRLLAAMIDQSIRMLMSGQSIENLDTAMRQFGFQGGPFEIMDVIGIDTCMYAGRTMWEAGLECVSLSPVLPKLVKNQRLGRKTGLGFYRYETLRGRAISDPNVAQLIEGYISEVMTDSTTEEIQNQILSVIAREAFQVLRDKIVSNPHDLDLCVIHGFSFPKDQGGILFWADQFGLDNVVQTLHTISDQEPRLKPPAGLEQASKGDSFYPSNN